MSQSFDAMEYIWERLPKEKDGKTIVYLPGDLPYLYHNGFVDTNRFTLDQWTKAFKNFKQDDDTYLLNKKQFLALRLFRYNAIVVEPFDAHKLKEGSYSDEKLELLYKVDVKPSSGITEEIFWNSVKALKKQGLVDKDGNLIIDKKVKTQLNYLIERFPSPRRRLEKEVSRLRQEKETQLLSNQKNRDASGFSVGQTEGEFKLDAFQKLQGSQNKTTTTDDDDSGGKETLDIKKLRRPTPKMRG